jgi:uncharacterized protein involved in exopolysaccharide biosynthesis
MTKNLADEMQRTARAALTGLQPVAQGEEPGGLSFRRLLAAAFRARYLLFATTLFGLLIGTFLAITTANSYASKGTFQLTGSGAEKTAPDPTRTAEMSQETIATSATYILNTDDLLKKVVAKLGAATILAPYQPGGPDVSGAKALFFAFQRDWNATREEDRTPEEALKRLKRTISVERPRFTDVILVSCVANNAELAQKICETYMVEAIQTHIDTYDSKRAYDESKKTYEDAQTKHTLARNALREFLDRKAKVDDFDSEKRRLQAEVADATAEVNKLDAQVRGNLTTIEDLAKKLSGPDKIEKYITEMVKPGLSSAALEKNEGELIELYKQLAITEQTFSPNSEDLKQMRAKIAAAEFAIKRVQKMAQEADPVEVQKLNPTWQSHYDDKTKLEASVAVAKGQLTWTKENQAKIVARLRELQELEPEFETLRTAKLHAANTESAAQINSEAWEQKRALGQGNFSAIKTIEPATLPLEKEGPNRGKLLLGGFFVGLFLGLGVVVLRSLPDTVVRTRDDLEQIEGLAVVGIMPRLDGANLRRHVALREQGW